MTVWKDIQKKNKYIEIIITSIIIICLIIGSVCDWNVLRNDKIIIEVEDISSFSLTVLQIQATVGTLIFTIIALISGNISDSYMGVSIGDFYLNIRPWNMSQKVLIIASLALCLMGVVSHALNLYNIVFYLFIASLIVILLSIKGIYSAFGGRKKQEQEIEAYIDYLLSNENNYKKKNEIFKMFVIAWKEEIDSQDKQNYEKYRDIFLKAVKALWKSGKEEGLKSIQQQCYIISYAFLWSEKMTAKERGIEFIQDVYEIFWEIIYTCIKEEIPLLNQYKSELSFFSEINNELIQNMDELSVEHVEKRLRFGQLTDLIQRTAIWFKYDDIKDDDGHEKELKQNRYLYNYSSEINELYSFAKYIGYYLGKQQRKNNTVNQNIWANVLSRWNILSAYNIPKDRENEFLGIKVNTYFNYCYGMLVNGQENVVKQGLYLDGMKRIVKIDNKFQALLYLAVHCYVYYLAVREQDNCITTNVRRSAINIWSDKEVRDAFLELIYMLAETPKWLDLDMLDQLHGIVDRFELFPLYGSFKTMIIESVVSDFYLFLILFISNKFCLPELLERNIDDMRAFRYVSEGNERATKETFKTLFKAIFIGNKTEEQIDIDIDLMYEDLIKTVKNKQKRRCIELAQKSQEKYKTTICEEEICENIKNKTISVIKEKFSPILTENDEKNGIIRINLFTITDYTDSIGNKRNMDGCYSYMNGNFLLGIMKFLCQRKIIETKNRFEDFNDDKEFMEYLSEKELYILMGSQYILKNKDYRFNTMYNNFMENYETIYTSIVQDGLALKRSSLKVCLHDINVSIHSPSIKEIQVEFDKESQKYKYPIMDGLPIDFEEEELREFLYNNRKVINVTAKVSIQVDDNPCGTLFTGKKKR